MQAYEAGEGRDTDRIYSMERTMVAVPMSIKCCLPCQARSKACENMSEKKEAERERDSGRSKRTCHCGQNERQNVLFSAGPIQAGSSMTRD